MIYDAPYSAGRLDALGTLGLSLEKIAVHVDTLVNSLHNNRGRLLRRQSPQATALRAGRGPSPFAYPNTAEVKMHALQKVPAERQAEGKAYLARVPRPQPWDARFDKKINWPGGNNVHGVNAAIADENLFAVPGTEMPQIRLTGQGHRAFNAMTGNHEMRETQIPTDQYSKFMSHGSLRLVGQDRNLVRGLTGPGADEARAAWQTMRGLDNENQVFDQVMGHYFGPQAVARYGHTGTDRLPSALLNRLSRYYARDTASPEQRAQLMRQISQVQLPY